MWSVLETIGSCIAGGLVCFTAAYFGGLVALDKFCEEQDQYDIEFEQFLEKSEPQIGWENLVSNLKNSEKR